MKKIAILDPGYKSYEYEQKLFRRHGYELVICDSSGDGNRLIELASDATGILVRGTVIGVEELDAMPHLKAIVRYGVGYDNIDIIAARKREIRVANVQGYANHAVSDHAMALMYACIRDLFWNPDKSFGEPSRPQLFELHNKTLGIIGIGRIGSQFSIKASHIFERILVYDPYKPGDYMKGYNAEKVELNELLKRCNVISLHCNLTDETRHMLNKSSFGMMEQNPVIINTSRGPVIDEKALLDALNTGLVHSAGLDVFENEPIGDAQENLLSHPHVIYTPHIAWYSDESIRTLQVRAADNMIGLLSGEQLNDEL